MKVYVVVNSWTDLEKHYRQYNKIFLNPVDAYKLALEIATDGNGNYPEVLEEELSDI